MSFLAEIREVLSEMIPLTRRAQPYRPKHGYKLDDRTAQMPYGAVAAGFVLAKAQDAVAASDEDFEDYSLDRLGFPVILFSDDQLYDDLTEDEDIDFMGL